MDVAHCMPGKRAEASIKLDQWQCALPFQLHATGQPNAGIGYNCRACTLCPMLTCAYSIMLAAATLALRPPPDRLKFGSEASDTRTGVHTHLETSASEYKGQKDGNFS